MNRRDFKNFKLMDKVMKTNWGPEVLEAERYYDPGTNQSIEVIWSKRKYAISKDNSLPTNFSDYLDLED
jgi:hypothetical protein